MVLAFRLTLAALGLLYLSLGAGFMLDPTGSGADFGLIEMGSKGTASVRADFSAFFLVSGGCLVWGSYMRKSDPLLVSAALMGAALIGRAINLAQNGAYDGWLQPMVFEGVTVVLALIASRILPVKPNA